MRTPPPGLRAYRADRAFDGDRVLAAGATVLVHRALIVGVEERDVELPADCDLTYLPGGGTLLSGLVDTHVHLCADGTPGNLDRLAEASRADLEVRIEAALRRHLQSGVTAVRGSWRCRLGHTGPT
jgi:imidazolonepropionase-like amidohydrolase